MVKGGYVNWPSTISRDSQFMSLSAKYIALNQSMLSWSIPHTVVYIVTIFGIISIISPDSPHHYFLSLEVILTYEFQVHRRPWLSMGYRIASPPLVVLVAHRVFAFCVGNCQTLEVAPFETCVPTSSQLIACPVAHRFTTSAVWWKLKTEWSVMMGMNAKA